MKRTAEPCAIDGCEATAYARGWCTKHYQRWRVHGDPTITKRPAAQPRCSVEGCCKPARDKGWCLNHLSRWERYGNPVGRPQKNHSAHCTADACSNPVEKASLCQYHYGKKVRGNAPPCSIEGCANRTASHGLCQMHLYRKRRYGDPLIVRQVQGDLRKRLLSHIDQRGPDDCWPWTGTISPTGYAISVKPGGGNTGAHRLVYQAFVGEIPEGQDIDHLCHMPEKCAGGPTCPHRRCCNPKHLAPEEPVANTMRGNSPSAINARKTHCKNGHEFNEINTSVSRKGKRTCRPCRAEWKRKRRQAGLPA